MEVLLPVQCPERSPAESEGLRDSVQRQCFQCAPALMAHQKQVLMLLLFLNALIPMLLNENSSLPSTSLMSTSASLLTFQRCLS